MNLTEEQQKAVTTEKNLSVIASAGTGKTTVLTQRFLHCYKNRQTSLSNILAFTFTEKASQEMKERLLNSQDIKTEQIPLLNISTIHAFCHRILTKDGSKLGLKDNFDIYDEDSHQVWINSEIKHWLQKHLDNQDPTLTQVLKYYGYANLNKTIKKIVTTYFLPDTDIQLKCLNIDDEIDITTINDFLIKLKNLQENLLERKLKNQIISYDDLEILCLRLWDLFPEILQKLQSRYQFILVDEFQDVSPRQFKLIKKLFNPEKNEIFIVGDPKQSIYAFRGADSRLFFEMNKIIENYSGELIYLTETFRTPITLQNYFNAIFPKVLSGQLFQKAHTQKDDPEAMIFATSIPEQREKSSSRQTEYAEKLAETINNLILNGTPACNIAVLFYTKSALPYYQYAFDKKGISYITESSSSYFDSPLILLLWHLAMYLSGEYHKITQVGLLRNPLFNFSENFIEHLIRADGQNIFTEQTIDLFSSQKDRDTWIKLSQQIKKWKILSTKLFATELIQTIAFDLKSELTLDETLILGRFLKVLHSWKNQGLYTLHDVKPYLKNLESLNAEFKCSTGNPNGIRLLTIHSAKGLEFDHVFIIPGTRRPNEGHIFTYKENEGFIFKKHDCESEKSLKVQLEETEDYKLTKTFETQKQQDELSRLLYVALTRSKKSLYFYLTRPSESLIKKLEKSPNDTSIIKNFNDWLYWLTEIAGKRFVTNNDFATLRLCDQAINEKNANPLSNKLQNLQTDNSSKEEIAIAQLQSRTVAKSQSQSSLTVTELETLTHCPIKFKLKYLQKIKPIKNLLSFPLQQTKKNSLKSRLSPKERGNLYHEILQFYDYKHANNLDTVIDQALFNQHIVDSDHHIRKQAKTFIVKLQDDPLLNKILHDNVTSYEEVEFSCKLQNFILAGQIDKVVQIQDENDQDKWMIIDYKTHHTVHEEERERLMQEFNFQMSCYALAITKAFELESIETLVLFTSGPTYRILNHSKENLEAFEDKLNNLYSDLQTKIQKNDFVLTADKSQCQKCGYFKDNYCGVQTPPAPSFQEGVL